MNVVILRKKQRLPGRRKRMKLRFMWGRKLNGHPVKIFVVIRPMKADIRRMQAGQYSDSHSNHIYSAR